jgi:hypothetical protein
MFFFSLIYTFTVVFIRVFLLFADSLRSRKYHRGTGTVSVGQTTDWKRRKKIVEFKIYCNRWIPWMPDLYQEDRRFCPDPPWRRRIFAAPCPAAASPKVAAAGARQAGRVGRGGRLAGRVGRGGRLADDGGPGLGGVPGRPPSRWGCCVRADGAASPRPGSGLCSTITFYKGRTFRIKFVQYLCTIDIW